MTAPTPNQMPGAQQAAAAQFGGQAAGAAVGGLMEQPAPPAPATAAAPLPPTGPQSAPTPPPAGPPATAAAGTWPPVQPPSAPPAPGAEPAATPPWEAGGEPFDPARAWKLIQDLRADNDGLKGQLTPLQQQAEAARRAEQGEIATLTEDRNNATSQATTWRNSAVRYKAEALAATARFRDPADAITMLGDLSGFVDGDAINEAALTQRINALATEKSYLLADGTTPPPPPAGGMVPNRAQDQSGAGSAATLDAQIAAAQARGDHATAIALKQHKHFQQR